MESTEMEAAVADLQRLFSGLNRLATRARVRRALHAGEERITMTDGWLLAHLKECGPARMSALAEWQVVDPSTMTAQVKRLEAAGLARREVDPSDRRATLVSLTHRGEQLTQDIRAAAAAFFGEALKDWSEKERRELIDSLTRLSSALEAQLS